MTRGARAASRLARRGARRWARRLRPRTPAGASREPRSRRPSRPRRGRSRRATRAPARRGRGLASPRTAGAPSRATARWREAARRLPPRRRTRRGPGTRAAAARAGEDVAGLLRAEPVGPRRRGGVEHHRATEALTAGALRGEDHLSSQGVAHEGIHRSGEFREERQHVLGGGADGVRRGKAFARVSMEPQVHETCSPGRVCLHPPPPEGAPVSAPSEEPVEEEHPALRRVRARGQLGVREGGHGAQ